MVTKYEKKVIEAFSKSLASLDGTKSFRSLYFDFSGKKSAKINKIKV